MKAAGVLKKTLLGTGVAIVFIVAGVLIPLIPLIPFSASGTSGVAPLLSNQRTASPPLAPLHEKASFSAAYPMALPERHLASYLTLIYLQTYGEWQGGALTPTGWDVTRARRALHLLEYVVQAVPESDYPFFLASEVWGGWQDRAAQREVLEWVVKHAEAKPEKRWRWIVQAIWVARYRWHDLPTAVRYASLLQNRPGVPPWAQSLGVWIYESNHNYKAAQLWIGQLLEAGIIHDPAELAFLEQRLKSMKNQ